jgi:hypothetical protein
MRGWYAFIVVDRVPPLRDICDLVGCLGEFYACFHQNMDGSYIIEIASTAKWTDECVAVFIMEFYGEAFLEAGGVHVVDGHRVVRPARRSSVWLTRAARVSLAADPVDVIHPRAVHASDFVVIT